jgi:tetratricopeptide (TPR) repeat protein
MAVGDDLLDAIPPPGGGRVVIQTTRTEATALLAGLRFWIPRLRNPPELEVLAETTCAELELAEPITDRRIRVWNLTASEIPPFRPSPPHGRLAMPTGDGVEVIITTLAPQSFGGPKRTDREWPVPRLSTAPFEPPHVSSPSEVGDALRRWLLFDESPPPSTVDLTKLGATVQSLASRSREATPPPAAASEALSASTPPTPAGVDDCDIGAVNDRIITLLEEELDGPLPLDELTSFTVGLLLSPRDDDGNPSAPLREFAKIIHRLGLAHPIGSGTPQVLAYTPSLRAAVLGATSRRYLSGSLPTRNGWATTELHAIAPDFRYDNPKDPPDHKILTDRLIDLSWSTGNASACRRVAGANRVALAALCAAGGHQPPAHWPGGQTWFGELAPIVELIERSVQGLPRHPADEYPRPAKRGKIHILGVENPTPEHRRIAEALEDAMVEIARLTPMQHALMTLTNGPLPGASIHQSRQLQQSALASVRAVYDADSWGAGLIETAATLAREVWTEEAVHLHLDAALLGPMPEALTLLNKALAIALRDNSTHSIGHAVEILTMLARQRKREGDDEGCRKTLRTAARLTATHDSTRFARHASALLRELRTTDPDTALLLEEHIIAGQTDQYPDRLDQAEALLDARKPAAAQLALDSVPMSGGAEVQSRLRRLQLKTYVLAGEHQKAAAFAEQRSGTVPPGDDDAEFHFWWGVAAAAISDRAAAAKAWEIGADSPTRFGGRCALHLARLDLDDFQELGKRRIVSDPTTYPFPLNCQVSYLHALQTLRHRPLRDNDKATLRLGLVSPAPQDQRYLADLSADRFQQVQTLESELSEELINWLKGTAANPPHPLPSGIERETVEAQQHTNFTNLVERLAGKVTPTTLWTELRPQIEYLKTIGESLWDDSEYGRARRYHLAIHTGLSHTAFEEIPEALKARAESAYAIASLYRTDGNPDQALKWADRALRDVHALIDDHAVPVISLTDLWLRSVELQGNGHHSKGEYAISTARHHRAVQISLGIPPEQCPTPVSFLGPISARDNLDFSVVRALFNYSNSLRGSGDDNGLATVLIMAAIAFSKVDEPEQVVRFPTNLVIVQRLAKRLKAPPPEPGEPNWFQAIRDLKRYGSAGQ